MLGRTSPASLVGLLVVGLLTIATPARAGVGEYWTFDDRPAGMPATDVPGSTIASAEARVDNGSELHARIVLGATPDPTQIDLHIAFGATDAAGGCVPSSEVVVQPSAEGPATTVDAALDPAIATGSCAYVAVTDHASQAVLDRVDGQAKCCVIVDPPRPLLVRVVTQKVRPHRWSGVRVKVHLNHEATWLRVRGSGKNLGTRPVLLHEVPSGTTTVRLPVRLHVDAPRRLRVTVSAAGPDFRRAVRHRRVRLLVRR